ncbi:MAG: dihydroneopterin aldolase [Brevinematales bacterium]|jgi:FolB domain-containing protein
MDSILIRDLLARCIIGINEDERREKQDVLINITLRADLKKAGISDRFEDAVDYRAIKKSIFETAESSSFFLVEALAEKVASLCLSYDGVKAAKILVEKPSALRFARSVGVEIYRTRGA